MSAQGFRNTQEFFNLILSQKISSDPQVLSHSGILEKNIGVEIHGPTGGVWVLSFNSQGAASLSQIQVNQNHCTVEMSSETFEGLLAGTVNVPMAFVFRKIKVKGDTALAIKLGQALQKLTG
jgi:hypothetical protein